VGATYFDSHYIAYYMAFQYHVGPFHLSEAITRSGGLGGLRWLSVTFGRRE